MSIFKEFKEFAIKGNMIDLATGVIIGGAFGKIVTSLVNDIVMPLISLFTGKVDFSKLFLSMDGVHYETLEQASEANAATLNYGLFITNVIDFLIISVVIFIVIKQINRFKAKPVKQKATTKECPFCKTSIHLEAVRCPHCTSNLTEEK